MYLFIRWWFYITLFLLKDQIYSSKNKLTMKKQMIISKKKKEAITLLAELFLPLTSKKQFCGSSRNVCLSIPAFFYHNTNTVAEKKDDGPFYRLSR